ncbi:hypothetical protein WJX82_004930 [Trebouxia sp. C0006]
MLKASTRAPTQSSSMDSIAEAASPTDQLRTSSAPSQGKPLVVLLHGLARGRRALEKLRRRIQEETGLTAVSLQYPSTRQPINKLAAGVAEEVKDLVLQGGISWKGIVMIAPPNQGSTVAHQLSGLPGIGKLFQVLYGSAGVELGTEMATGNVWPDPPQPCGIIAGNQSLSLVNPTSWLTSAFRMIPGPNDGTVAVEETKLTSGLKVDTRVLHLPHTTIASSPLVAPFVIQFLRHGTFLEETTEVI